ncbi:acyltransferase family protein [Mycobacterium gordonae]|uniref:Acyltransferase n=1 Tax=Mycobacterium gordonae TaxID=1778 RepID=A0A1X1VJG5_MYCGO|nr:acyltransferase family protein [Mycobacterium gordonae]MBX9980530.1 acyltransferase [Mycobacterium gordonae]MCV7010418.1 acyltransferase [Mycobacterium gordonae]ODR22458.1 acyltransferase [Mycobacterium gordonae]ORV69165.1 acyltransferase [Mycobacterium gordonae]
MTQQDRAPFRPDIEGLRAVAVIAVVLYHAGIPGIAGGYIGVDVFFVISGFLITGLLLREVRATETVALGRFYAARARRLLPAAATVGIVTAVVAAVVLPPLQARRVFADGIASMLYVGNYRFAAQNTDYMVADLPPSPFQHYWSLGVEEQFYLVWPALIIGTAWLARRIATARTLPYAVVVTVVGAASLAAAVIWTRTSPPWAFFSLPTRAWELAAGGLVALTINQWKRLPLLPAAVAGWGGLTLILLTCTQLGPHTPYPGTSALLPVLGTALVIGAGCVTGGMGVGRLLCPPVMRAIGRVSYSWYLWHWPVLLLLPPLLGDPGGLPGRLAATTVSAGLAVITMHAVENPGRFATALRRSAKASLAVAGAASAVAACACAVLLTAVPAPVGHGAAAPQAKIVALPPVPDPHLSPQEAAVRQAFAQAREMLAAAADQRAVPSNLTPSLAAAPADKAAVFVNGCMRSWRDVGQSECASVKGDGDTRTTVALIGDSHAAMWDPALQRVAEQRHWRLETMAKVTCPFLDIPIVSPYLGRKYTECEQWRGEIVSRLAAERPRLVVLSMSRRYHADFSFASYDPAWIHALATVVAQLRGMGSQVLVLGPVADPQSSAPTCLSAHLDDAGTCAPARSVAVNGDGIDVEQRATTAAGGSYADLTDLFCSPERCPLVVGDTLVFRDDNHVTTEYAQLLAPVLGALADRTITNE